MSQMIYQVPLEADAFEIDNRKLNRIILDAVADSGGAYAWIKEVKNQDGQAAILKLGERYDGQGPKSKRTIIIAEKKLEQLHYKNEWTLNLKNIAQS
jgi:hypothetical protein